MGALFAQYVTVIDPLASAVGGASVGMTTRGSVGLSPLQAATAARVAAPNEQARRLVVAVRMAGYLGVEAWAG